MILTGILIISFGLYIFAETDYKIAGIVVLSIGLNCFATYYKLQNIEQSNQMTNWKNRVALISFENLKTEFDMPLIRVNQPNGLAMWRKTTKQNIYDEIIVKDEEVILIENNKIQQICTYFIIKIYIPPNKLDEILKLSKKINYNRINYLLTIFTTDITDSNKLFLQILNNVNKFKNQNLEKQIKLNLTKYKLEMETMDYKLLS